MKNDSNPIIRSEEVTIDMHICAALSESRSSGEIYFAAIAPDMELTVITLDEAPDILPCFDEDDAYLNIPDSSLLLSYNPAQVLKLAGKHYLTGPVIWCAPTSSSSASSGKDTSCFFLPSFRGWSWPQSIPRISKFSIFYALSKI